uniref:leukocyte receptor cluster member 1 homolog n=1 Tax=Ciona intestinalis TaxID=7719 RepID=UPI000180CDB1|nr:leukocyte receptor cluster member 1 homolog [Ciona intestinalis]|eukprot:XP_002119267.1 leukocyte receptor cluster member 1 homolog [Ciona intestinalis]
MNILPKKSWHVRNKDNVAKVRKDEEEARQQEKEQARRAALAEQEARLDLLRNRSRGKTAIEAQKSGETSSRALVQFVAEGNKPTNLFEDIEKNGVSMTAKNAENEEEKRKEKEEAEKKIGLLTYLGQGAVETLDDDKKPWYFKVPDRLKEEDGKSKQTPDPKRKAYLDPLEEMKQHLSKKKKKKHKSHKDKDRVKDKHSKTSKQSSTEDKLSQMRKARLEREAKEKQRSLDLLNKHYGVKPKKEEAHKQFEPKYNNQFNPHLARNNRSDL